MPKTLRELLLRRARAADAPRPESPHHAVAALWGIGALLAVLVLVLHPPTARLGPAGWAVSLAMVAVAAACAWWIVARGGAAGGRALVGLSSAGVVQAVALAWLAGAGNEPYRALLLPWLVAVALLPTGGGAVVLGLIVGAWSLPIATGGLRPEAGAALATEVVAALAAGLALLALGRRLRAQREALGTAEREARARAEDAVRQARGLEAVGEAALTELPFDALLAELVRRVADLAGADGAALFLHDARSREFLPRATHGTAVDSEAWSSTGRSLAARAAEEGGPAHAELPAEGSCEVDGPAHAELPPEGSREVEGAAASRSLVAVPLLVDGRASGVLEVLEPPGARLADEEVRFLQLAADRVALAVERARLNEQAHRIAETLQRSLLPTRLPEAPGVSLASRYHPGAAGTRVGGDLFDVVAYGDGRVGLAIGDVVGHGVEAASLMGRLRNALQAFALEGDGPERALERLNRLVSRWEEGRFATLLYLVFDPRSATVTVASAGHLPPLVRAADGTVSYLEGLESVPLGVLPVGGYRERLAALEPGATLLLYTDGLVEERGVSLERGLDRLREEVEGGPPGVEELCDHVLATVPPCGESSDDVAMLAMRLAPVSDHSLELRLPARPESLARVRRTLEHWLSGAGADGEEVADVLVASGEAAANAVSHAYGPHRPGDLVVEAKRSGDEVEIAVRDFGYWRPPRRSDGGRGIELMRRLMASVQVLPGAEGTTVRLRRPLRGVVAA